jgi:hypothetical protein
MVDFENGEVKDEAGEGLGDSKVRNGAIDED